MRNDNREDQNCIGWGIDKLCSFAHILHFAVTQIQSSSTARDSDLILSTTVTAAILEVYMLFCSSVEIACNLLCVK